LASTFKTPEKIKIDENEGAGYGAVRDWKFEHSTGAAYRSAAAQGGSRVLTHFTLFQPHCRPAVGFLFWDKRSAAKTKIKL